jgi:hypothetical protein
VFCNFEEDNVDHAFIGCVIVNIIWSSIPNSAKVQQVIPTMDQTLRKWWQYAGLYLNKENRSKLNSGDVKCMLRLA